MKLLHRRTDAIGKVLVSHSDGLAVGARLKNNFVVLREEPVHIDLQPVEIAKRRHRADVAVREQPSELFLSGQSDMACSKDLLESLEIQLPRRREHRHHQTGRRPLP